MNVSGDCGRLILTWSKPEPFYTLTIEFAKVTALQASDESSFTWRLKGVSFLANLIDNPDFENATGCNSYIDDIIKEAALIIIIMERILKMVMEVIIIIMMLLVMIITAFMMTVITSQVLTH